MGARLIFHGQSAFLVETDGGKNIYIDPWLKKNPVCPPELKTPQKADLICLTHGHFDHTGLLKKSWICDRMQIYPLAREGKSPRCWDARGASRWNCSWRVLWSS